MNMKRLSFLFVGVLSAFIFFGIWSHAVPEAFLAVQARKLLSSVFFVESTTTEALRSEYQKGSRIRILIVPGHDNLSGGTEFLGVREVDMTLALGEELYTFLRSDPHFEPIMTRNKYGYTEEFQKYFKKNEGSVKAFVVEKKSIMQNFLTRGLVEREQGVVHNTAASSVAYRLYSINMWANENDIDLVIHIHFNDYPGRRWNKAGRFDGFTVYVPEKQYSNARASTAIGKAIATKLSSVLAMSNLPTESGQGGIMPDQELIALGSYNTLDPASVLIEYGYIYEPQFLTRENREEVMHEYAFKTYLGLNQFFGNFLETFRKYQTSFLPYYFERTLTQGSPAEEEVFALQEALSLQGMYPPEGEDLHTCPKSGHFGLCTTRAVQAFQVAFGLSTTGFVDRETRGKLNELYRQ